MAAPGVDLPDLVIAPPAWMERAACRGQGPTAFFPGRGAVTGLARQVCAACPVAGECLDHALADPDLVGIWAGTSPRDRARLRRERGVVLPRAS